VSGGDNESGANGYWYYLNGSTTGIYQSNISNPINITSEGVSNLRVVTVDKAGNRSTEKSETIKIDKNPPVFPNGVQISNMTTIGFTLETLATDTVSGNSSNNGKITYSYRIVKQGTTTPLDIKSNQTGTVTLENLDKYTRYHIENFIFGINLLNSSGGGNGGNGGGSGPTDPDPDNPDNPGPVDPDNPDNPDNPNKDPDKDKPWAGDIEGTPVVTITPKNGANTGDGHYYTGDVSVKITDSGNNPTNATIYWRLYDEAGQVIKNGDAFCPSANFEYNSEGIYKIEAWIMNGSASVGKASMKTLIIDKQKPTSPKIVLNGDESPDKVGDWYKGNITATITPGVDATSKVWGVEYYVTGANSIGSDTERIQVQTTDSTNINITVDGKSQIYAYTIDNAEHRSQVATIAAWKDTQFPSEPELTVTSSKNREGNFVVMAKGADQTKVKDNETDPDQGEPSGIASYTFYYRVNDTQHATGNIWEGEYKKVSSSATYEFPYPAADLEVGTTYDLKVTVTDAAGNTNSKEVEGVLLEKQLGYIPVASDIGKTISGYTPNGSSYTTNTTNQGGGSATTFANTEDVDGWRIWKVTDTQIQIISTKGTPTKLYLGTLAGYNNGVKILDDICGQVFSNSTLKGKGATARNMKLSDIIGTNENDTTVIKSDVKNLNTEYGGHGDMPSGGYTSGTWPKVFVDNENNIKTLASREVAGATRKQLFRNTK